MKSEVFFLQKLPQILSTEPPPPSCKDRERSDEKDLKRAAWPTLLRPNQRLKIRFSLVIPLAAVLELGSEASLSKAEEAEEAES